MGLFWKMKKEEGTVQVTQEFLERVRKELKLRDEVISQAAAAIRTARDIISAQEELITKAMKTGTELLTENTKLKNTIDRMHEAIANEKK